MSYTRGAWKNKKLTNLEQGIKAENMIVEKLRFRNKELELEQNHTWGIDIILNQKEKKIKIEVKSATLYVKDKRKPSGYVRGKFCFQPIDLEREIDYFAFVINKPNNKVNTFWVRGEVIRNYFSTKKRYKGLSVGIPTLLTRISKVDFSEVIDL